VDPDVIATGQPYAYTGDDPVNATDPLGNIDPQQFWDAVCILGSENPEMDIACGLSQAGLPSLECSFGTENPSQPCPGNENQGVIQAQGTTGNPKTNKGAKWTQQVAWNQSNVPTVSDGLALVDALIGKITQKQYDQRKQSFLKLVRFIVGCGAGGGCIQGTGGSWSDRGNHSAQRVDIEIRNGMAFIPDSGIITSSYFTSCGPSEAWI
jgi:hypothetical protein